MVLESPLKTGALAALDSPLIVEELFETQNLSLPLRNQSSLLFNHLVAGSEFSEVILFGHAPDFTRTRIVPEGLPVSIVRGVQNWPHAENGHLPSANQSPLSVSSFTESSHRCVSRLPKGDKAAAAFFCL